MKSNIVLIGFAGAGKTSVGKRLARILNRQFFDTDQMIERVAGLPVPAIIEKFGEKHFRAKEKEVIKDLSEKEKVVVSTGGGAVVDRENFEMLKKKGLIICLSAKPEVIYYRVKEEGNRPLLQKKGEVYWNILRLMREREEIYRQADFVLDTSDLNYEQIIDRILTFLIEYRVKYVRII